MYKLFIAWRFLWARLVSYVGTGLLALAVMLFVIVMAVMEGMGDLLRENIRKTNAHVQIVAPAGPGLADWRELMERMSAFDHVKGVTPSLEGYGQAAGERYSFKCGVRGIDIDIERRVGLGLGPYLSSPPLPADFDFRSKDGSNLPLALVGHRIAGSMEIRKDELVTLSVIQLGPSDKPGRMGFVIGDEFKTDSMWLDHHILVSLKDAQRIFGSEDRVTILGVWLDDHRMAHEVKRKIQLSFLNLDPEEEHMFRCMSPEPLSVGELARRAKVDALRAKELIARLRLKGGAREVGSRPASFLNLDPEEEHMFRCLSSEPLPAEALARRAKVELPKARELIARLKLKGAAREVGHLPGHYVAHTEPRYVEYTEPQVKTWADQHPDLFRGVAHEGTIMRIILVIVIGFVAVLVWCFLWVLVEQKVRDIGILVALGGRRWGVVSIFVLDGLLIGLVGTAVGLVLGTLVAWKVDALAGFFGLEVFPPEMFYGATELPSAVRGWDLVLVAAVAMTCAVLASIPPAFRAAAADPIKSLRHE
jgi:ABC-type lipoprotein release transport system permease subunit